MAAAGLPAHDDDERAFTPADVDALRLTHDLMELGILSPDRMSALTRTWGRSFARLAEWQVGLLATVTPETGDDPAESLTRLADEVLPRVEELQSWVWRRHLAGAANRMLAVGAAGETAEMAVCFVDIVGYTSRSRTLSETELVQWLEAFESDAAQLVVEHGGRIIKNIGDEVLIVADDPAAGADIALELTRRGADEDDEFPPVRAGLAYGEVVNRLGDVFGPVVNIASRLTSVARPGHRAGRRGRLPGALGTDRRRGRRREQHRGVLLPAGAAAVGEGLLAAPRLGDAPGQRIVT